MRVGKYMKMTLRADEGNKGIREKSGVDISKQPSPDQNQYREEENKKRGGKYVRSDHYLIHRATWNIKR